MTPEPTPSAKLARTTAPPRKNGAQREDALRPRPGAKHPALGKIDHAQRGMSGHSLGDDGVLPNGGDIGPVPGSLEGFAQTG